MSGMALWRLRTPGGARLACGRVEAGPEELLPAGVTIDGLLGGPPGALATPWPGLPTVRSRPGRSQPSRLTARRCGRPG